MDCTFCLLLNELEDLYRFAGRGVVDGDRRWLRRKLQRILDKLDSLASCVCLHKERDTGCLL